MFDYVIMTMEYVCFFIVVTQINMLEALPGAVEYSPFRNSSLFFSAAGSSEDNFKGYLYLHMLDTPITKRL